MQLDQYLPGSIIYTDKHAVKTSSGSTNHLIAGNVSKYGYKEGRAAEALFSFIRGLTLISKHILAVVDV